MEKKEIEIFYPTNQAAWREWLVNHHLSEQAVWLVFKNKKSGLASISWSQAVDVALCFGWIDSKKVKIDEATVHQFFSKRKPNSTWSKINKEKVEKLTEQGLMTEAGLSSIEIAKQNDSWTILDQVEALIIPTDLDIALAHEPNAKDYFLSLSKSTKKIILSCLYLPKQRKQDKKELMKLLKVQVKI